jgi:hypothetical protein
MPSERRVDERSAMRVTRGLPPPSSIVRRLARGRSIEGLAIEVNNAGRLTAFC